MRIIKRKKPERLGQGQAGFTLLELIITFALIAILATIAVPSFQGIAANGNLKTAARDLAADLANLRQSAITSSRQNQLNLNLGANTYTLTRWTWNADGTGQFENQVKNLTAYANDISFNGTTDATTFVFFPRGTVTADGIQVVLSNGRTSTATIGINAAGRTSVSFNLK